MWNLYSVDYKMVELKVTQDLIQAFYSQNVQSVFVCNVLFVVRSQKIPWHFVHSCEVCGYGWLNQSAQSFHSPRWQRCRGAAALVILDFWDSLFRFASSIAASLIWTGTVYCASAPNRVILRLFSLVCQCWKTSDMLEESLNPFFCPPHDHLPSVSTQ